MPLPQRNLAKTVSLGAPVAGLMVADSGYTDLGKADAEFGALFIDNFVARDLGLTVRPGSVEQVTNIPDSTDQPGEVRSILEFLSPTGPANNKTFACTDKGIFNVTAGGAGPWIADYEWITPGGDAGWVSSINHTNPNGDHFLLCCDEQNGYVIYDDSLGTWSQGTITGGDPLPENLVQVTEWQNRIFFVERNSTRAWYLPIAAIEGNPVSIELGSRFLRGGSLQQLTVWTVDDGAGLNDRFLALSSGGDLLAFSGTDPDDASTFVMDGRWFVGTPPKGRRSMSEWAGEVYITSSYGMVLASTVISGEAGMLNSLVSRNITRYFRAAMAQYQNEYGWGTEFYGALGVAVFTVPNPAGSSDEPKQFVLNLTTKAWTRFVGLDMVSVQKITGKFLFGTHDGVIYSLEGTIDNVDLNGVNGEPIEFALLTHYRDFDSPGTWKRVQFIRPYFIGDTVPSFVVRASYDYSLLYGGPAPVQNTDPASVWDSAVWDAALWGGGLTPAVLIRGANNMGRNVAVEMYGSSVGTLSILRWDVIATLGGVL